MGRMLKAPAWASDGFGAEGPRDVFPADGGKTPLSAPARTARPITQWSVDRDPLRTSGLRRDVGACTPCRALPLIWAVEAGAANLGFEAQRALLERVLGWLPSGARVLLAADRFYPSAPLFAWLHAHAWGYRLRLKGNHALDVGCADAISTGDFARGFEQRFAMGARLFESGIETNIGMLHEPGHPEPWIVAMECVPTAAAVRDYGLRWGIEPMFSDFKSRGFGLEDTQLRYPERVVGSRSDDRDLRVTRP